MYICMCTTVDHHVIDRITLMWFPGIFLRLSFFFFFQFDKRIIDKWQHPSWKYVRTKLITFLPAKPKSCSLSYIPDVIPEGNVAKIKVTDVASKWAGGALTYPEFGVSVNPILTRGEILCPPNYCLPTRIWKPKDILKGMSTIGPSQGLKIRSGT